MLFLPFIGIKITFWISLICLNCLLIKKPYGTIKTAKRFEDQKNFYSL